MRRSQKRRAVLRALVVPPLIANKKSGKDVHACERMIFRRRHVEMFVPLNLLDTHVPLTSRQSTRPLAGLRSIENSFYLRIVVWSFVHILVQHTPSQPTRQSVPTGETLLICRIHDN